MTAKEANAGINAALENAWKAACGALDETTHEVFLVATENFIPIDTGLLKASTKDEVVTDTSEEHTREISSNTPYAIYVHEILTYYHPHGSAKYLENPLRLYEQKLFENVKSKVGDSIDN